MVMLLLIYEVILMVTHQQHHFLILLTRRENTVETLMIETINSGAIWGNISPKVLVSRNVVAYTEVLKAAISILFTLQLKIMNKITRSLYHTLIQVALSFIMICT
jgi:hypothetical protein